MRLLPALLLLVTILPAGAAAPRKSPRQHLGVVRTAREARQIAELETGGIAVSARKTRLNGASCGWEVDVHMPKDSRGWRCMVDCDTRQVHTKDRIPNPPVSTRKPKH